MIERVRGLVDWKIVQIQIIAIDTLAYVIYSIYTAPFAILIDLLGAEIEWGDLFPFRVVYGFISLLGSFLCAKLTRRIEARLLRDENNFRRRLFADWISLCIYKIPIYVACAFRFNMPKERIRYIAFLFLVETAVTARWWGKTLSWTRSQFAVTRHLTIKKP